MVYALATFIELTHVYEINTYNNNNYMVANEYKIRENSLLLFGAGLWTKKSREKKKRAPRDVRTQTHIHFDFV